MRVRFHVRIALLAAWAILAAAATAMAEDPPDGQPEITIISPNGGESLTAGKIHIVRWTTVQIQDVILDYSADNGDSWSNISASVDDSMREWGNYPWMVPDEPSDQYLLRIVGYFGEAPTTSATTFSVVEQPDPQEPSITIISPNGGEVLPVGKIHYIQWSTNLVQDVNLAYSTDKGASWNTITPTMDDSMPEWGNYPWMVPEEPSSSCLMKITEYYTEVTAVSATTFEIRAASDPEKADDAEAEDKDRIGYGGCSHASGPQARLLSLCPLLLLFLRRRPIGS